MLKITLETIDCLKKIVNKDKLSEDEEKKLLNFIIHYDQDIDDKPRFHSHSRPCSKDYHDDISPPHKARQFNDRLRDQSSSKGFSG